MEELKWMLNRIGGRYGTGTDITLELFTDGSGSILEDDFHKRTQLFAFDTLVKLKEFLGSPLK